MADRIGTGPVGNKMVRKKSRNTLWLPVFITVFSFPLLLAKKTDSQELDRLYKMAQFSRIASIMKNSDYKTLSLEEKFLYIECLARSAQRNEAKRLLQETETDDAGSIQALVTSGIVHVSCGQFVKAEYHLRQALQQDPGCPKVLMALSMLELYLQKYQAARKTHEEFLEGNPEWEESYLSHLLGLEVYGAAGDIAKIAGLYKIQAKKFKKLDNDQHQNFRKNARLYRKKSQKGVFQSKTATNRVVLPFVELANRAGFAAVSLEIKDEQYKVLLDTGNRVGWTIHSREMEKRLKHKPGGTVLTQIGVQEGKLHGHHLFTKQIKFRDLMLRQLPGLYVPKPRLDYPEANLNPLYIKDRIVTLDFINKEMILRSKERFHDDFAQVSAPTDKAVTLPWYGYEQAFIPVLVNNELTALAMIETGAEDITVNLDFARRHRLSLEPEVKYLPTGKEFLYHKAPIRIQIGPFKSQRRAADVWLLDSLADPITGIMPDILLGPDFFKDRFVLTFDPYQKSILLTEFSF